MILEVFKPFFADKAITEFFTMIDSRAKNMFIGFNGSVRRA